MSVRYNVDVQACLFCLRRNVLKKKKEKKEEKEEAFCTGQYHTRRRLTFFFLWSSLDERAACPRFLSGRTPKERI